MSRGYSTDKKYTGALLMLITAMVIYGSVGIFRRYIPLSSSILACYRGFMGTLILASLILQERMSVFEWIGALLILGTAFLSEYKRSDRNE